MVKKAVQQFMLGTVTNSEADARETLSAIKAAGYDGIELCGFMIHPTGLMVRMLTKAAGMPSGKGGKLDWHGLVADSGLEVVCLHTDLGTLERDARAAAEEARSFGTDRLAITGMYRFAWNDGTEVRRLAERLNRAGEALAKEGLKLLWHNHNCELQRLPDGRRVYDVLIDDTDPELVNFEFDSYWFAEAGANPEAWMQRLGARMQLWHIADRGTRLAGPAMTPILESDSVELGSGNMPLERLAQSAEANGIDAVILESHRNWIDNSPIKSLQLSAKWLNARF